MFRPNRLKELRIANELSQVKLANMANISRSVLSEYENGISEPTASVVARLAGALGCSSDYLLDLENDYGAKTSAPIGEKLTSSERELLSNFRKLSPYLQGIAINTVRGLTGAGAADLHKKA